MDGQGDAMQAFTPGPETARAFRDALGRFATGVTVVTAPSPAGPLGITANSFASVSLDPPMVLWSPAKSSARFGVFSTAPRFAIHVIGAEQADVATRFVRNGRAFEGLNWALGAGGVPLIAGCLARFECDLAATHDGGDHLIVLGNVLAAEMREGTPLVFCSGGYGEFSRAE